MRAVNLFGYGRTPSWPDGATQSLDDQAALVEAVLSPDADEVYLVGHSFGGSVAMKAAARLRRRVTKLVLLEPNTINLLAQAGYDAAFGEAREQRDCIQEIWGARRMGNRGGKVRRLLRSGPGNGAICHLSGGRRLQKRSSLIFLSGTL